MPRPCVRAMQRLHAGRGIAFSLADGVSARLAIEPDDFAEILSNLLDNAGKWARSGVVVDWTPQEGDVLITVVDDGPGIPADERAGIFAVGRRLDEQAPGHGLGLTIARDVARSYGGEIELTDRSDGASGLLARIRLPRADD